MAISAAQVKELREKSGAGMMDCKTALKENDGDVDAAMDWLRTKGIAKADKKSGRTAAEGLIGVAESGSKAAMVEVNSETDFVARNENFQTLVRGIVKTALATDGTLEAVSAGKLDGKDVANAVTEAIATIGENMSLRRTAILEVEEGVVASYVHNAVAEGLGKIGVLVALQSPADPDRLRTFGRQVAMHVAATNPLAGTREEMDPAEVERERRVFTEQARESGKPDAIIEKMVTGRIEKFYKENVLLSQTFVIDGESSVEKAIEAAATEMGQPIAFKGFVRFQLGEGIEKDDDDFAAEVASMNKPKD